MKKLFCIIALIMLTGCSNYWTLEYIPVTEEERQAVAKLELEILATVKVQSLAGHDQDWDDTIQMAHREACKTMVKPRLWEHSEGNYLYTGKYKEVL
jgi:uncharacterized lipoprotein YajG